MKNLLLIIEDLHWADASTLEWLRSFIDLKEKGKVFLLCTTRPTLRHDLQKNDDLITMELHRLSSSEMKKICLHQSNGKDLPKAIMEKIMIKTEGVPGIDKHPFNPAGLSSGPFGSAQGRKRNRSGRVSNRPTLFSRHVVGHYT